MEGIAAIEKEVLCTHAELKENLKGKGREEWRRRVIRDISGPWAISVEKVLNQLKKGESDNINSYT